MLAPGFLLMKNKITLNELYKLMIYLTSEKMSFSVVKSDLDANYTYLIIDCNQPGINYILDTIYWSNNLLYHDCCINISGIEKIIFQLPND